MLQIFSAIMIPFDASPHAEVIDDDKRLETVRFSIRFDCDWWWLKRSRCADDSVEENEFHSNAMLKKMQIMRKRRKRSMDAKTLQLSSDIGASSESYGKSLSPHKELEKLTLRGILHLLDGEKLGPLFAGDNFLLGDPSFRGGLLQGNQRYREGRMRWQRCFHHRRNVVRTL